MSLVAHSKLPNVPMMARLTFEEKYQKLWRCAGSNLLTKSIADVNLAFAAARVMDLRLSSMFLESNLIIARCKVTSAAK